MRRWLDDILNFAFPATCHVCDGKLAPHERFVCAHCLAALPRTGFHRSEMNPMEEKLAGKVNFERATGHFFYTRDSALSKLIQDMKYRHYPGIGNILGETVARELFPSGFFNGIAFIIPVPMHFLKQARRGYNQTHHIAEGISSATGIPIAHALKAIRPHKTQTSMTQEQRLENTSGIFSLHKPETLENKRVVIVDDVCTTGSTIASAASAIIAEAPSCRVTLLTIGVTF